MEDNVWTRNRIEEELRDYKEVVCIRDTLKLDIEALEDYLEHSRDEAIEGGAVKSPQEPDMPRSNTISDPTARLARKLDEEVELTALRIKWRFYDRRVRRVETWLAALPNRERKVTEMFFARGMTWFEITCAYNRGSDDGGRSESALRGFKRSAIDRIVRIENREIDTPAVVF